MDSRRDKIVSYKLANESGDRVNALFSRVADFSRWSPRMSVAPDLQAFLVYYRKLQLIDARLVYFFFRQHKEEMMSDPERKQFFLIVQSNFEKPI